MSDQAKLSKQNATEDAPTKSEGEWMDLEAAADLLGVSGITLRRHAKKGAYKARRNGRSQNSKIQIFVDSAAKEQSKNDRVSTDGFEGVLNSDKLEISDSDWEEGIDFDNAPLRDTLKWMQDALSEKDAKIHELNEKLMGAHFRNGFLESQIGTYTEQIKLITQTKDPEPTPQETEAPVIKQTAWQKFGSWFKSGN